MKILIALLALNAAASTGLAQGTVTFQNSVPFQTVDPTGGDRLVYGWGSPLNPTTGVGLTGTQYVAELYVGADASSLQPVSLSISRFRGTTTLNKGKWATTGIYGPNNPTVLPGFLPGEVVTLQMKVWDLGFGTTFENKTGGFYGQSSSALNAGQPAIQIVQAGEIQKRLRQSLQLDEFEAVDLLFEPSRKGPQAPPQLTQDNG